MPKNDYWANRERKWIEQQIKDDALIAKKIELEFNRALVDVNKDITAFYTNYAKSQNISMAEAMARVSAFDVKGFESTAKQMVADKDFSPNANERLKLYNATMRINRLEYLKSQIGVELVKSNGKIEKLMGEKLAKAYQQRVERQSGILSEQQLKDVLKSAKVIVNADFQGATWSDRIWANNDTLKSRLEQLLTRSLVQGINPNVLARELRDQFKKEFDNARYMAERLMRTETARVQDVAQMKSFEKYGYKYCKWIAEPSACKICLGIVSDGEGGEGIYPIDDAPTIPVHANCRCSKAAYVPDKTEEAKVEGLDTTGMLSADNEAVLNQVQKGGADEFYRKLNAAPEDIKKMFMNNKDLFKFEYNSSEMGVFYKQYGSKIVFGNSAGSALTPVQTAFHEMVHAIDYSGRKKESFTYDRVMKRGVQKLDYKRFTNISDSTKWGLKESLDKESAKAVKLLADKYGYGGKVDSSKWRDAFIGGDSKKWSKWGDFSDIIQAGTNNDTYLGYGHERTYWKSVATAFNDKDKRFNLNIPNGHQEMEFVAEATSAMVSNPESYKVLQQYFPESLKIYEKIIKEMLNG